MIIIGENNLANAYYDEKNKLILFETKNVLANKNIDKIEFLLNKAIEISSRKLVIAEIVDLTNLRGNFTNVLDYLILEYYPIMHKNGMKRAAYVVSNDLLSLSLVQRIVKRNKVVETKAFPDLKSAKNWVIRGF